MPLKLNIGLSKKLGLPDYGSLGATCHVELELDGHLLQGDLDGFHRHVRNAYAACRQAVNEELARSQSNGSADNTAPPVQSVPAQQQPAGANGHTGNGHAKNGDATNGHKSNNHRASQKQLEYAGQLAVQITGLGLRRLEVFAQNMFGIPLAGMSNLQASSLIDTLKEIKAGNLDLEEALQGVPT